MKLLKTRCEIIMFKSIEDTIEKIYTNKIDLIISDLQTSFRQKYPNGIIVLQHINQIVLFYTNFLDE